MPVRRGKFTPPSQKEQLAAIGLSSDGKKLLETDLYDRRCQTKPGLWQALNCCFDPSNGEWEDLQPPQSCEWLDSMIEKTPDQSFREYVASRPNRPSNSQKTIYLQPLCTVGENEGPAFPQGPWPSWQVLEAAVKVFYGPMNVVTLPAVPMERLKPLPDSRKGPYGKQWHAGQVLEAMTRQGVPNDAYGVMAVTMCDLYPKPEWNFVYGLARLRDRVGVFSFVRHTPQGGPVAWREAQMLHRSLKTLLHEIGHMFGLKHCTWYNCLMRGSNGEGVENQLNYLHLCPVCLRKLHWNIGFDIPTCYAGLLDIYQMYSKHENFSRDCEFLQLRLQALHEITPALTLTSDLNSKSRSVAQARGTNRSVLSSDRVEKTSAVDRGPAMQFSNPELAPSRNRSVGAPAPKLPAAPKARNRKDNPIGAQSRAQSVTQPRSRNYIESIVGRYTQHGIDQLPRPGAQNRNLNPTCGCCVAEELVCPSCQ